MTSLFFITGNSGKFSEVKTMLPDIKQLDIDLPEIQSLDAQEVIKEKLLAAKEKQEGRFIVEDTSVSIAGLGGLPGTYIKWFLKSMSLEKIATIAQASGDVSAEAKVCIGYTDNNNILFFEGIIKGKIVQPRGSEGFGWDKIFQPDGFEKTFGEMSREEKNTLSMRKKAVEKLKNYLQS